MLFRSSRDEIPHETFVRRKISEHPASAVEEDEDRQRPRHAERAHDHKLQGPPLTADGPFGNVRLREVDIGARLEALQYRARLRGSHLLHRPASSGREGSQKGVDIALDSVTCGGAVHRARALLSGGNWSWSRA